MSELTSTQKQRPSDALTHKKTQILFEITIGDSFERFSFSDVNRCIEPRCKSMSVTVTDI